MKKNVFSVGSEVYETPMVFTIDVQVERGFATSTDKVTETEGEGGFTEE
ncbi:MAG: hypothetical protein IKY70_00340 [Bacteroidales bacterium]|nr:hypothetical protein [Bacteroidales bacterium]